MTLWHSPELLGVKLNDKKVEIRPRGRPAIYYPQGGHWLLDLKIEQDDGSSFGWSSKNEIHVKGVVQAGAFKYEIIGETGSQAEESPGGPSPGSRMALAFVASAISGKVVSANPGHGTTIAVDFGELQGMSRSLRLLLLASPNMMRDLQSNTSRATADPDW